MPSPRSCRHLTWWASRVGGALLVSATAHALAAVTFVVVARSLTEAPAAAAVDRLDVEVVPLVDAPAEDPPRTGEPQSGGAEPPVARRASAMRRPRAIAGASAATPAAAPPASASARATARSSLAPVGSDGPARFALGAGPFATWAGPTATCAPGTPRGGASGSEPDAMGEGDVDVPARLLSSSPLVYPPVARQAEIETDFPVEIVVGTDGRVAAARAVRSVGFGLDEAALHAIRAYRFSPALRAGRPVRVRMRWTVQFRLR